MERLLRLPTIALVTILLSSCTGFIADGSVAGTSEILESFKNESVGETARFSFKATAPVQVTLAYGSSKQELDNWEGLGSTSFADGGVLTAECTSETTAETGV